MITTTLGEIVASSQSLQELSNKPLKGKIAYKIGKLLQEINKQLQIYDKTRYELLKKYCIKDDTGKILMDDNGNVTIQKDKIEIYNKEINDMNNTQIEINALLIDLEDIANIEITPKIMMQLDWIIKK